MFLLLLALYFNFLPALVTSRVTDPVFGRLLLYRATVTTPVSKQQISTWQIYLHTYLHQTLEKVFSCSAFAPRNDNSSAKLDRGYAQTAQLAPARPATASCRGSQHQFCLGPSRAGSNSNQSQPELETNLREVCSFTSFHILTNPNFTSTNTGPTQLQCLSSKCLKWENSTRHFQPG